MTVRCASGVARRRGPLARVFADGLFVADACRGQAAAKLCGDPSNAPIGCGWWRYFDECHWNSATSRALLSWPQCVGARRSPPWHHAWLFGDGDSCFVQVFANWFQAFAALCGRNLRWYCHVCMADPEWCWSNLDDPSRVLTKCTWHSLPVALPFQFWQTLFCSPFRFRNSNYPQRYEAFSVAARENPKVLVKWLFPPENFQVH